MNRQSFITLTLIISGLASNPVMANAVLTTVSHSKNINHSVSYSISSLLYSRGLDKDVADEMSENLLSDEDEILLAILMEDLDRQNIVSKKEVLEYLSTMALHKQKLDLHSFDHLVGMVSKIKQKPLESKILKQLHNITKNNKQLFV